MQETAKPAIVGVFLIGCIFGMAGDNIPSASTAPAAKAAFPAIDQYLTEYAAWPAHVFWSFSMGQAHARIPASIEPALKEAKSPGGLDYLERQVKAAEKENQEILMQAALYIERLLEWEVTKPTGFELRHDPQNPAERYLLLSHPISTLWAEDFLLKLQGPWETTRKDGSTLSYAFSFEGDVRIQSADSTSRGSFRINGVRSRAKIN